MEKNFNPLAWAAASNNNAATVNGQVRADHVNNHQGCAEGRKRAHEDNDANAELLAVVGKLVARGINITESYHDWLRVGFALAWELGSEGREAFHQLSAQSAKYRQDECDRKWHELLRTSNGRTTGSTIFWLAQQAGIDVTAL